MDRKRTVGSASLLCSSLRPMIQSSQRIAMKMQGGICSQNRMRASAAFVALLCSSMECAGREFIDEQRHLIPTFCNKSPTNIGVAVIHTDWNDPDKWLLSGWLFVPPKSCTSFHEIPRGTFYVYASSMDIQYWWAGEAAHACVSPRPTERVLFPNEECVPGEESVGFSQIDTDERTFRYDFRWTNQ